MNSYPPKQDMLFILGNSCDTLLAYYKNGEVWKSAQTHLGVNWEYSHTVSETQLDCLMKSNINTLLGISNE